MLDALEAFWKEYERDPLSRSSALLFFYLLRYGGRVTWREIQKALRMSSRSLSKAFKELSERGLISYVPTRQGSTAACFPEESTESPSAFPRKALSVGKHPQTQSTSEKDGAFPRKAPIYRDIYFSPPIEIKKERERYINNSAFPRKARQEIGSTSEKEDAFHRKARPSGAFPRKAQKMENGSTSEKKGAFRRKAQGRDERERFKNPSDKPSPFSVDELIARKGL